MQVSAENVSESHYQCSYKSGILKIGDKKKHNGLTDSDTVLNVGKKLQ